MDRLLRQRVVLVIAGVGLLGWLVLRRPSAAPPDLVSCRDDGHSDALLAQALQAALPDAGHASVKARRCQGDPDHALARVAIDDCGSGEEWQLERVGDAWGRPVFRGMAWNHCHDPGLLANTRPW